MLLFSFMPKAIATSLHGWDDAFFSSGVDRFADFFRCFGHNFSDIG
jgi:hypothetical protein